MRAARKARDARLLEEKCVHLPFAWHSSESPLLASFISIFSTYKSYLLYIRCLHFFLNFPLVCSCASRRYAKFGPFKELAMRDDVQAALTKLERAWMPKTLNW